MALTRTSNTSLYGVPSFKKPKRIIIIVILIVIMSLRKQTVKEKVKEKRHEEEKAEMMKMKELDSSKFYTIGDVRIKRAIHAFKSLTKDRKRRLLMFYESLGISDDEVEKLLSKTFMAKR